MDSHLATRITAKTPITPGQQPTNSSQREGFQDATRIHSGRPSKPTNPFPPIQPLDSFWSVSLPFDTDLTLYDDYVRFDGGVRFERILEDLDAFAGNVAHLHVKKGTEKLRAQLANNIEANANANAAITDMSIVTASVDGETHTPNATLG